MSKRTLIINIIGDLVSDLMYYDRKTDEDLPVDAIEDAVEKGEITIEEIADEFRTQLYLCFRHRAENKQSRGGPHV